MEHETFMHPHLTTLGGPEHDVDLLAEVKQLLGVLHRHLNGHDNCLSFLITGTCGYACAIYTEYMLHNRPKERSSLHTFWSHTHTHIYIYISSHTQTFTQSLDHLLLDIRARLGGLPEHRLELGELFEVCRLEKVGVENENLVLGLLSFALLDGHVA